MFESGIITTLVRMDQYQWCASAGAHLPRRDGNTAAILVPCRRPACRYLRFSPPNTNHHALIAGESGKITAESTGIPVFLVRRWKSEPFWPCARLNFIRSCYIASNLRTLCVAINQLNHAASNFSNNQLIAPYTRTWVRTLTIEPLNVNHLSHSSIPMIGSLR